MPQIVVIAMSAILLGLIFNPILFINAYFIFRPLVDPFAHDDLKLLSLPINWPFTAVMLVGIMFYLLTRKGFKIAPYNTVPLYAITFLSLLSLAFSINLFLTLNQLIKFISAISIVLLVANTSTSKKNIINIYKGIVFSSLIPMLYGYYQYFTRQGHVVLGEHTDRVTSFFGFANLYGIYLALIMFCTLIIYVEEDRRKWKRIYGIILLSLIVSTILALNRGTWISITLGLILAAPFYKKHLNIKYFIYVFAIIGIAAAGIMIKRFLELEDHRMGANTFNDRLNMWHLIFQSLPNIPFLGYGAGTARQVMEELFNISLVPHNDYLKLLLEIGYLGPLLYVIFLFKELYSNVGTRHLSSAWHVNYFTLAMIIYWIVISFAQNIYHDVVMFPIFLSACTLSRKYGKYCDEN